MKIAFDYMGLGLATGNSAYTTGLIKGLATGFPDDKYHLYTYWQKKKRIQNVIGNLQAVKICEILPKPLILGRLFRPMFNAIGDGVLRNTIKYFDKADLYHCTNPIFFTYGIKTSVVTIHDLIALQENDWASQGSKDFYHKNIARIISDVSAIFTVSNHTRADIIHHFPEAKEKIYVTHLGIDERFKYQPVVDRSFLNTLGYPLETPPFLLCVGETQPRKNIHGLITAYSELPLSVRKNLHLVIAGNSKRHEYREMLFSLVQKKNLRDCVHFFTNVSHSDLVKLYNAAHAFIYPSFLEGFGIPVAEAMSCGCPVLTSSISSLPEVGGDAALYTDPNDTDEFKDKLRLIIEDDLLRQKLREKGFIQAAKFNWKNTVELTHAVYQKICLPTT